MEKRKTDCNNKRKNMASVAEYIGNAFILITNVYVVSVQYLIEIYTSTYTYTTESGKHDAQSHTHTHIDIQRCIHTVIWRYWNKVRKEEEEEEEGEAEEWIQEQSMSSYWIRFYIAKNERERDELKFVRKWLPCYV